MVISVTKRPAGTVTAAMPTPVTLSRHGARGPVIITRRGPHLSPAHKCPHASPPGINGATTSTCLPSAARHRRTSCRL
ncbi:hypothetical protein E2C01_087187 [Portunus trituberculatus]|uniref:Uncharacterized protein n=1 Tax=Portunus trituberculatus TaxID=210409 RepID=A0A5B7JBR7_PORTR|nr:hypothetical protein [Portunus trituberculatus]